MRAGNTVDVPQTHRVDQGESLVSIAKQYTNDTQEWVRLYNRNRDLIGGNPSLLKVGTVLHLPREW